MIGIERLATLEVPGPTVTALTAPFWEAAREHRLLIQRCTACERPIFYPRACCPYCWADSPDWIEATGEATLDSWSVVSRPGHPGWRDAVPYTVALVRLAEGPVMLSQILGDPRSLRADMPLRVVWVQCAGTILPFFEPASAGVGAGPNSPR